jgi:hypothetical protein
MIPPFKGIEWGPARLFVEVILLAHYLTSNWKIRISLVISLFHTIELDRIGRSSTT